MNICVIFVLKTSIHSVYPLIYAGVSFPLTAKTGFADDDTCTLGILGGYIIKLLMLPQSLFQFILFQTFGVINPSEVIIQNVHFGLVSPYNPRKSKRNT